MIKNDIKDRKASFVESSIFSYEAGVLKKSRALIILAFQIILLSFLPTGCSSGGGSSSETPVDNGEIWRYFDRQLFFPAGVSVDPEVSASQEQVRQALLELELATDLGRDFFIFQYDDDSLLQPVASETVQKGREWKSFVQIWKDDLFNQFVAESVGTAPDSDIVVAQNEKNKREYYIILRLSCFVAGEACGYPTQVQARAIVWRAFGYLIGLRFGVDATSEIMRAGVSSKMADSEEIRKYNAEFNSMLERMRNGIPAPGETTENGEVAKAEESDQQ